MGEQREEREHAAQFSGQADRNSEQKVSLKQTVSVWKLTVVPKAFWNCEPGNCRCSFFIYIFTKNFGSKRLHDVLFHIFKLYLQTIEKQTKIRTCGPCHPHRKEGWVIKQLLVCVYQSVSKISNKPLNRY